MTLSNEKQSPTMSEELASFISRLDDHLGRLLPKTETSVSRLCEAMRYSVFNGGKRMRPLLVYGSGRALGVQPQRLDAAACAVEMIHAYSLIHDDLPAMDDDNLRRGQPTCHRAFDEATAILAGDALQALAFQVLAGGEAPGLAASNRCTMLASLAHACGAAGMAGGQAIDLESVGQKLTLDQLEKMHNMKTGALICASVQMGYLAAGTEESHTLACLDRYAQAVGLAFQVHDDILDVTGDTQRIGKRTGADHALGKPTYPAVIGLDASHRLAANLCDQAIKALADLSGDTGMLHQLALMTITRDC